jgi:3-hydroxyisobutyrate dehydrogenase-like beta-hydroxyacid dehydrogenase
MTSALPDTVKEIGKAAQSKGIKMLDAPVSGGVPRAVEGSLTIMVGGEPEVFERCKPILQAMGKVIHYTGELGSGKAVKMINQFLNAGNTAVAAEAVYLAERMGLDMDTVVRVVGESSGASWVFANTAAKAIIPRNFKPGFRLDLMAKDVGLSMDYARQNRLVLPVMNLIQQIYQSMLNQGHGAEAYSVISQWTVQQNLPPNKDNQKKE